jgi:CBS domain-containing protein
MPRGYFDAVLRRIKAIRGARCSVEAHEQEADMRVKEVMTEGLIGVPETATLWDALNLMVARKVSALVVFDVIGAPIGILSEGDLMRRAEFGAEKHRPHWLEFLLGGGRAARDYSRSHGHHVRQLMTPGVLSVDANAEIGEAVDIMSEKRVRRLVVFDGADAVGVLSRSDLVRALMFALPPQEQETRSDARLQTDIEAALARESWAPVATVRVAVKDGVATLVGAIPAESMRDGLKALAEGVSGVKAVRDDLAWIEPNSGLYMDLPHDS